MIGQAQPIQRAVGGDQGRGPAIADDPVSADRRIRDSIDHESRRNALYQFTGTEGGLEAPAPSRGTTANAQMRYPTTPWFQAAAALA